MTPGLASALAAGTWKVAGGTDAQQKALLSQVSAVLQSGQPVSLAVRNSGSGPTRILTTGATFSTVATTTATVSVTTTTTTTSAVGTTTAVKSLDTEPTADNS